MIKVTLLSHTPNAERVCAAAARNCYSPISSDKLYEGMTNEQVEKLLRQIIESHHDSILEHCVFTFGISGISRNSSHQIVRHRIATFAQKSLRYVGADKFDIIVPKSIQEDEELNQEFENIVRQIRLFYDLCLAKKISKDDARYIIPNGVATDLVMTMNARELRHFFNKRCCFRASEEIQEIANQMLKICKEIAPLIFENAGPSCITLGHCPEGKMSCGKIHLMRNKYIGDNK